MEKRFHGVLVIKSAAVYREMKAYAESLISCATQSNALTEPAGVNVYTREISRVCSACADYENIHLKFEHLKVKNPLILAIEQYMRQKRMRMVAMSRMLNIREAVFEQVMLGKRKMSLSLAKKLYMMTDIDPRLILEYA